MIYIIIVYFATAIFGGAGSVRQTAANVGWCLLPLLFANIAIAVLIRLLYVGRELPTISPTHSQLPPWLFAFQGILNIAGTIWTGYILVFAIQDTRKVSVRRAAVIAGFITVVDVLCMSSILL